MCKHTGQDFYRRMSTSFPSAYVEQDRRYARVNIASEYTRAFRAAILSNQDNRLQLRSIKLLISMHLYIRCALTASNRRAWDGLGLHVISAAPMVPHINIPWNVVWSGSASWDLGRLCSCMRTWFVHLWVRWLLDDRDGWVLICTVFSCMIKPL
jgi:hypothetical protein